MNVMWYVGRFDEATWQLLAQAGMTPSRMRAEGVAMAAVEQHIVYKRELHAGDVISVRSDIIGVRDKSVRIAHEMTDDDTGQSVASMIVVGVQIDAVTRKARPLPVDVRRWMADETGEEVAQAG